MGGGAHVVPQVLILRFSKLLQRIQPSPVAIFADESVHRQILPEPGHAGSQDDQLPAVGDGHTGAVYRLVAQPCRFELTGLQVDHALFDTVVHEVDVLLLGQCHRFLEGFPCVPNK